MHAFKLNILLAFLCCAQSGRADPLNTWHMRKQLPTDSFLFGITYGNGQFIAVGGTSNQGVILTMDFA